MENNTNILKFSEFVNETKWNLTIDVSSKWNMLKRMDDNDEFEKEGDLGKAINSFCYFIVDKFKSKKDEIIKLTSESGYRQLESLLKYIESLDYSSYETHEEFQDEFHDTWNDIYDWCDSNRIWLKTNY